MFRWWQRPEYVDSPGQYRFRHGDPHADDRDDNNRWGRVYRHIDETGLLEIGPESRVLPCPVCYGLGNTRPTVTDANLVLGRIDARNLIGEQKQLDRDAAMEAIRVHIALPLSLNVHEAAEAIIRVANAKMGGDGISIERGHDPNSSQ